MSNLQKFLQKPFSDKLNSLRTLIIQIKGALYYRRIFGSFGRRSVLRRPILLANPRYIHIGDDVSIRDGVRLEIVLDKQRWTPELRIGDRVLIEQNVQIICHSRVSIGSDVSIAGACAIVDVTHPFRDVHSSRNIGLQISEQKSFVEIGDRAFLGYGVVVLPNVRIGRSAVIGANSVVTRDVPDFSIAAGVPAVVREVFDHSRNAWIKIPATERQLN